MRDAVKDQADLIAISDADRTDITWSTDDDMEKAHVVYVSGNMFPLFGLEPALGRLLTPADDRGPGLDPYAVLSWDYWNHRFGRDPHVLGRRSTSATRPSKSSAWARLQQYVLVIDYIYLADRDLLQAPFRAEDPARCLPTAAAAQGLAAAAGQPSDR